MLTEGTELGLGAAVPLELGCGAVCPTPFGVALCVPDGLTVGVTVCLLVEWPPVTLPSVVPVALWPHTLASIGLPVPNSISVTTSMPTRNTAAALATMTSQRGRPRRPLPLPPAARPCLPGPPGVPFPLGLVVPVGLPFPSRPAGPLRPSRPL